MQTPYSITNLLLLAASTLAAPIIDKALSSLESEERLLGIVGHRFEGVILRRCQPGAM